ncbi:MAG: ABC transporter substrate-binding protein [Anaerolineae bacterium]|jgi:ABC-type amino acid transport substrate-binding protein|nr:ABC transporter substrate-binding protein [Anaerolineae bacterium]MDH7474863.1 ABC transporter substrate-binding protein [Anaerolineae bacterium]
MNGRAGQQRAIFLAIAVALTIILATMVACWQLPGKEDRSLAQIRQAGVLRVGLDASYPPFEEIDEATGEIHGFDVDLARELARRLGVKAEIVNSGWDGLYDALEAGRFDAVISGLVYDPWQTDRVAYSISYFNAGQVLVVHEGHQIITQVSDLPGHTLGVEIGSEGDVQGHELSKRLHDLTLRLYPASSEVLNAVERNEVDAGLVDAISAQQFIRAGGKVRIVGEPLSDELYVVAVRLQDKALLQAINAALVEMRDDGTLARLVDKWL